MAAFALSSADQCKRNADTIPTTEPLTICLNGIASRSPLGGSITVALAGLAVTVFDDAAVPAAGRWRKAARGTALQWWSEVNSDSDQGKFSAPEIIVDLRRQASGHSSRTWCIVDAAGEPLCQPFHALETCYREPHVASLNLIESCDGGATWQLVADAHVSSSRGYRNLLEVLGQTSARLLQMGLRAGVASRRSWTAAPPVPHRPGALLRANIKGGLAWFQARISGEVYGIAVMDQPAAEFTRDQIPAVSRWLQIPSSEGFIADPFFWPGRPDVILCETYLHRTGLGELTILSLAGEVIGRSEPLPLGFKGHLSYPSTWSEDGRVFCLPEMAASGHQVLYELRPAMPPEPLCTVSMGCGMADPTLMKVDDLYWIAYTDTAFGTYDNLCLLYAECLEGPWQPHSRNPVKIDARSCRPGGTPFSVGRQLYRPAQDCSREYGGALVINRVDVCTPHEYCEIPVATLNPDPDGAFPDGLHTLSFGNGHAVIDGKRICYHPNILFQKMFRRAKSRLPPKRSGLR